ncbi:Ldh family oxidoreductase [Peribacillus cavernae]|uniref:Ldh family oxidoreductase n=1 Tax=Peribacillus cavernae TaxID=1674310 RepID=A0A433HWM1_9BACI|nr:Ldh family oxidoreductase [Peribacillus cavernae]MDQ0218166.1 LDH2 family malate/lactate/ureidoglycolate dehydrogenase [Peribacillus cavernae]RUQ32687.1 Ldh family oxidoreductase [Peribacillus cavernae]
MKKEQEILTYRVSFEKLKSFCTEVLIAAGIPDADAEIISDSLVHANLSGVHSHGVSKLNDYLTRLDNNLVTKETHISVIRESATTAMIDANNGWGQIASQKAVDIAVEKAKEYGSSWVGVNNSNHYGTASYWTAKIASHGMIGISMTNTSPVMVPFGSKTPTLGTNPVCIAVPSASGKPIMLDMATSNQARGKITLAAKNGNPIPNDWAVSIDGHETTDPQEALKGSLLPFGGAKGSGLAIMVDILTGVLTGSLYGSNVPRFYDDPFPQNLGHMFAAINIESMMPLDMFLHRMTDKERETRESEPAAGFEKVYMPGDLEYLRAEEHRKTGIPLSREIYSELLNTAKRYGVKANLTD